MTKMIDEQQIIQELNDQLRYLYVTRDKTIFERQITLLTELHKSILDIKESYIKQENEDKANKWLSIEYTCQGLLEGLKLFLNLKQNNPDAAWINLVNAQNYVHWSNIAYGLPNDIQNYCVGFFDTIENVLFPPQKFNSMSFVSKSSKCSICQKEFAECEHIRGELYMGQMCTEICTEIGQFHHLAHVDDPDDKRCRITHYGSTNPPTINIMTLLDESKQEHKKS